MSKPGLNAFAVNAPWTSETEVQGWRHFRVSGRRHGQSGIEIELMAVCDRKIRFWIKPTELEDPMRWRPGWQKLGA